MSKEQGAQTNKVVVPNQTRSLSGIGNLATGNNSGSQTGSQTGDGASTQQHSGGVGTPPQQQGGSSQGK